MEPLNELLALERLLYHFPKGSRRIAFEVLQLEYGLDDYVIALLESIDDPLVVDAPPEICEMEATYSYTGWIIAKYTCRKSDQSMRRQTWWFNNNGRWKIAVCDPIKELTHKEHMHEKKQTTQQKIKLSRAQKTLLFGAGVSVGLDLLLHLAASSYSSYRDMGKIAIEESPSAETAHTAETTEEKTARERRERAEQILDTLSEGLDVIDTINEIRRELNEQERREHQFSLSNAATSPPDPDPLPDYDFTIDGPTWQWG